MFQVVVPTFFLLLLCFVVVLRRGKKNFFCSDRINNNTNLNRHSLVFYCQGPDEGNILIHWRDGHLNNPGWAVGEQPYHTHTALEHLMDATKALVSFDKVLNS